jgi:hypothetical protein
MKTVAFLFFALFSAVSYGVTEAGTHSLEPDTYYHISFSFYGSTNTQGRIVNFNMPGFLLNSHSLSGAETCRFDRVIRTWRKLDKENVRAYFNTYALTDDESVRADVDISGEVDQMDYLYIKRHYFETYVIGS